MRAATIALLEGGDLKCGGNCEFDVSGCNGDGCGNDIVDAGETCDGDVGDEDCASIGEGIGLLSCDAACEYDVSDCSPPVTVSASATGVATDAATITLTCEADTCSAAGLWENLADGCAVLCGESDEVTVSISYPDGSLTVPSSIDFGAPMELLCAGMNPCTLTVPAQDGLDITVSFVAVG